MGERGEGLTYKVMDPSSFRGGEKLIFERFVYFGNKALLIILVEGLIYLRNLSNHHGPNKFIK